jgi:hypothetical protein
MSRRACHEVRGHWRRYERGELLCSPGTHVWGAPDDGGHIPCSLCDAWMTFIPEHERGDATLGYVTHDYSVEKDDPREGNIRRGHRDYGL